MLRVQLFVDEVMFCVVPTGSEAIPSLLVNVWPFCLAVACMALMPWLLPGNVLTLAVLLRLSLTAPGICQPSLTLQPFQRPLDRTDLILKAAWP